MSEGIDTKQRLILTDRKNLDVDGVESIIAFDESYIILSTVTGRLSVEGHELKVDDLSKNDGRLHLTGNISAIYYSDTAKKSGLSRFFK